MPFEIALAPEAVEDFRSLKAHLRPLVKAAPETISVTSQRR